MMYKSYLKKFESVKKQLQYVKKPVYTVVATKENELFMGSLVSMKNKNFACLDIHKDQLVCKVEITSKVSALLLLKVARIVKSFIQIGCLKVAMFQVILKRWKCTIIAKDGFENRIKW